MQVVFKSIAIALFLITMLVALIDIDKNNKGNYILTLIFLGVLILVI